MCALAPPAPAQTQQSGSIRGVVSDVDFGVPIAGAQVQVAGTAYRVEASDQGNFVLSDLPPGKYTIVFTKDGYMRQVKADVLVVSGQLTDLDIGLTGEFTELDELVVREVLELGLGTELGLLNLRMDSAALMDSIGSELMSRAGVGDAAAALRLVAGASTQDGKSAVIRGLPDRFISSQMNGVRMPSADEDKRAVELDQFPASVIESIQVTKTFTPDQQGDASGGAVDVRLRGLPEERFFEIKGQFTANDQVFGNDEFLTYDGGGVDFWGRDDGGRDPQPVGDSWTGAVGTKESDAPQEYKFSTAFGGKTEISEGVKLGGMASLFYERDASFYDDGVNDSWWVDTPGGPMVPATNQGNPQLGNFYTSLFDITQSKDAVKWGGLGTLGLESENNEVALTYLYTHIAEDTTTLATDTRGKEYFFPGYDVDDPLGNGNLSHQIDEAPYLRLETLDYVERTTETIQLSGKHTLPFKGFELGENWSFGAPELDWTVAQSSADRVQPDKRLFGAYWTPGYFNFGFNPPQWASYQPDENINFGNIQHIFKSIEEESDQYFTNLKFPFKQWDDQPGYLKLGVFSDAVDREYEQDTFTNPQDFGTFLGGFEDAWSEVFADEDHIIENVTSDIDYSGDLGVSAWYAMTDLPLSSQVNLVGGARFESTDIDVRLNPEPDAVWYPNGTGTPVDLNPGDGDVDFGQDDVLPSVGVVYRPVEKLAVRATYGETIARQTFKELTPVLQQEYLGGPVFIGNVELEMAAVENYDLRFDYTPYAGSLFSFSLFDKELEGPIEYVQRATVSFDYTTAVNYPEGQMKGIELEARQDLGEFTNDLKGVSVGANATFISSDVTLPQDESDALGDLGVDMTHRDMTNAPEYLYNLYATYDVPKWGTQFGVFWTAQGDTLVAGAAESNSIYFVPNVYALPYDTLNMSVSQRVGKYLTFQLQAKNLTNPAIDEVYRDDSIGEDVLKTSYSKGIDFSLSVSARFSF